MSDCDCRPSQSESKLSVLLDNDLGNGTAMTTIYTVPDSELYNDGTVNSGTWKYATVQLPYIEEGQRIVIKGEVKL